MITLNFNFAFADAVLISQSQTNSYWTGSVSSDGSFTATAKAGNDSTLFLICVVQLQPNDSISFTSGNSFPNDKVISFSISGYNGTTIEGADANNRFGLNSNISVINNSSSVINLGISCYIGSSAVSAGTTISGSCYDYISFGSSTPSATSKYTFQNGWLSVIDLGASNTAYNFDLSTSFNVNSGIVSQNWSETSQTYWFSDILPSVDSSYTNQGTLIPWERGTSRNVFGQTKDGIYNLSGTSTGRYLYILNPAFRAIADAEHPSIENHPVTVSGLTNGMKAYVYELTATATLSGVANAISTIEVDGQTVIANSGSVTAGDTSEDLTNSFVNSDNETIVQNQGGGNQNTTAQTINNYLENIQNVLDNFVNQFVGLLTAPISHIQQLISAGSNFFQVMAGLFSWLPSDLSSLVVSALSVCLVIGIIKMFL